SHERPVLGRPRPRLGPFLSELGPPRRHSEAPRPSSPVRRFRTSRASPRRPRAKRKWTSRNHNLGSSKSLSELEFEELKGFMDLGFVFSEQDRDDSDLVSILPGLQRLGLKDDGDRIEVEETKKADETKVPRPYLSEAWHGLDRQRKRYEDPLVNWRVPALGNEMAMKDHLKFWAHAVASTVR
ncbi:hypothetical protein EUGRSUZ_K01150, partial [Eucalyptus grandis]